MNDLCPYCNKRQILKKTCGSMQCQFKRHILHMRTKRKTDQKRPTRQIPISVPSISTLL